MTIQTIATLKANMPVGVTGGITAQDIQDFLDTAEDLFSQQVLTKTASYTATAADNRRRIVFNSATPVTLTLPSTLPVGWECFIVQAGLGKVTVAVTGGALGASDGHDRTAKQWAQAHLWVYANAGSAPQVAFSGETSDIPDPLFAYNWGTTGALAGGETVTRTDTATKISSSGVRQSAATNTVRLDYDGVQVGKPLGILLEPARTNILYASANPSVWRATGATVTVGGGGTGMDGTNSLSTLTATATRSAIDQLITIPSGAVLSGTYYIKRGTADAVLLRYFDDPTYVDDVSVWVNVYSGQVNTVRTGGASVGLLSAVARLLANSIVEVKVSIQTTGITKCAHDLAVSDGDGSIFCSPGQTLLFDTAQIELATNHTSYISTAATVGATASRGAETLSVPMTNGTYDILVRDNVGGSWANGAVVSGGAYQISAQTARNHVTRVSAYTAGALTTQQKNALIS